MHFERNNKTLVGGRLQNDQNQAAQDAGVIGRQPDGNLVLLAGLGQIHLHGHARIGCLGRFDLCLLGKDQRDDAFFGLILRFV